MLSKDPTVLPNASPFDLGEGRTQPVDHLQRELLEVYEQVSRAWLARVQSEVDLWSRLATKLARTRSIPEAMQTYQECISQRMQMAAEDGRRLSDNTQKIMQKITTSLTSGSPTQSA